MLLFNLATGCLASEHPFLHIDAAVSVQIEALKQSGLIFLPFGKQGVDVGFGVEFERSAAQGSEVAQGVDWVVDQELPFRIAKAVFGPAFFVTGEDLCVFNIDYALATVIFKDERDVAFAATGDMPFVVACFFFDLIAIPKTWQ